MSIPQTWSHKGFMEIRLDPVTLTSEYLGGDYIEVSFSSQISFPNANSLYHPFNVNLVEALGNNVYRFFIGTGFSGWSGFFEGGLILGQLSFIGTENHAPEVLWTQLCLGNMSFKFFLIEYKIYINIHVDFLTKCHTSSTHLKL